MIERAHGSCWRRGCPRSLAEPGWDRNYPLPLLPSAGLGVLNPTGTTRVGGRGRN